MSKWARLRQDAQFRIQEGCWLLAIQLLCFEPESSLENNKPFSSARPENGAWPHSSRLLSTYFSSDKETVKEAAEKEKPSSSSYIAGGQQSHNKTNSLNIHHPISVFKGFKWTQKRRFLIELGQQTGNGPVWQAEMKTNHPRGGFVDFSRLMQHGQKKTLHFCRNGLVSIISRLLRD